MIMKWSHIVLSAALLFGSLNVAGVVHAEEKIGVSFTDITNHWARKQIEEAAAKGYVAGFPGGTFKPDQLVTRAQFIKMIVTALDMDHAPEGKVWYETYVKAAKETKVYQVQDFAEKDMATNINREHMAWLAVRAADNTLRTVESSGAKKEITTSHSPMTAGGNRVTRTDAFLRDYYEGFLVHTAFSRGILNGYGGKAIGLERTTTRAQAVTVIERILSLREGKTLPSDKYATGEAELLWLRTNAFTVAPEIFDDKSVHAIKSPSGITLSTFKDNYMLEDLIIKTSQIHGEIKRTLLIDLNDPKDPYRHLLPPQDKMGIYLRSNIGKMTKDAYVFYMEYEVFSNNNPNTYDGQLRIDRDGYKSGNGPSSGILSNGAVLVATDNYQSKLYINPPAVGKGLFTLAIPKNNATLTQKYQNAGSLSFRPKFEPWNGLNSIGVSLFTGYTTHYKG